MRTNSKWPSIDDRTDLELLEQSARVVSERGLNDSELALVSVYLRELVQRYKSALREQKRASLEAQKRLSTPGPSQPEEAVS